MIMRPESTVSARPPLAFVAVEANMALRHVKRALARGRNHNMGDTRTDEATIE